MFDLEGTKEDQELAWRVMTIEEAIDWRWTISEVLEQDELLLSNVLKLTAALRVVKEEN
jgi:hypothetical protein